MTHNQKLRLARQLITESERRDHVPLFSGKAWVKRKNEIAKAIRYRILRRKAPKISNISDAVSYKPTVARRTRWQKFIDWVLRK